MDQVTFQIADLDGLTLGQATSDSVVIDVNAAGYGWFVDETPWDDTEFGISGNNGELRADDFREASGRMDLLTVVMHELGHVLGYEDLTSPRDLMCESLSSGVRRTETGLVAGGATADDAAPRRYSRIYKRDGLLFSNRLSRGLHPYVLVKQASDR